MAKPIPDGYHVVTPYLIVRGVAKALDFYTRAFGAEELFRMPGPDGAIMHAEMRIGDSVVMLGEENLQMGCPSPQSLSGTASSLMIYTANCDAAFERAVQAGATGVMPPQDMFWGDRFSRLTDPFGHVWSVSTHVKDLTPEEMEAAAAKAFAQGSC